MEIIYADVYFIVNFSMDFLALFICCKLRKLPQKLFRLCFGACVGSLYAILTLAFNGQSSPITFALSLAIPVLMTYIAFGYGKFSHFAVNVLTFWIVSFVMGGVMTSVYYFAGKLASDKEIYINGTTHTVYSDLPLWAFMLIAALCAVFTVIWNRLAMRKSRVRVAQLIIEDGAVCIKESALCDSGNLLTEPLSGLPVIILSAELMEKLAPGLSKLDTERISSMGNMRKVRIIPFSTISDSGILYGYIPEFICINGVEKRACVCSGASIQKAFEGHRAIIPCDLL